MTVRIMGSEFTVEVAQTVFATANGACDAVTLLRPDLRLLTRDFEQALYAHAEKYGYTTRHEVLMTSRTVVEEVIIQRQKDKGLPVSFVPPF